MRTAALALVLAGWTAAASAQEAYTVKADYVSGRAGLTKRITPGLLSVDSRGVSFIPPRHGLNKQTMQLARFTIPITEITAVSNTIDRAGPNAAAVAAFGIAALGSKRQDEYLYVTTESEKDASVIVFKVDKDTSAALVAKIEFARKRQSEK